jgi:hypothetical protein
MLFWVTLLSLDFVAVVSIIAGKAIKWKLEIMFPASHMVFDVGCIFLFILFFSGSLAVFRTIPFVKGVLSLLDLNSSMTEKAIIRRNKIEVTEYKSMSGPDGMKLPEGYGQIIPSREIE